MEITYTGFDEIHSSIIVLNAIKDAAFDEIAEISVDGAENHIGRVIETSKDYAVIQLFGNTQGISRENTLTHLTGSPLRLPLSLEILGRSFDGAGRPNDGLGKVYAKEYRDINPNPANPVSREYPSSFIQTGISCIDGLTTLIRGQKLPIFSGSGMPHDMLAAQIAAQAQIHGEESDRFAVVFAAMGVTFDVAEFFISELEKSGAKERSVMFINTSSDPVAERLLTPRCALTAAEYLAYSENMHVLVIMTDMTSYCEAIREVSSAKHEIPSRKGYPGYLYSDLASLYERAGTVKGCRGSVTQLPILTMPDDDITHPIPDLTGYITEGQIVLDRSLSQKNIYPPVAILPSLSRLMKDATGENLTRFDHPDMATQLFSLYAKVQETRSLMTVIGEDELSDRDKLYIDFGNAFEREFINQDITENRSLDLTLDIGWKLLRTLPLSELDRISPEILSKKY